MDLTIYNRWGEVVYQASAEGAQAQMGWATWDGTYRGQTVVTGTYGYKLNIKSTDFPDRIVRKGTIQVIR